MVKTISSHQKLPQQEFWEVLLLCAQFPNKNHMSSQERGQLLKFFSRKQQMIPSLCVLDLNNEVKNLFIFLKYKSFLDEAILAALFSKWIVSRKL